MSTAPMPTASEEEAMARILCEVNGGEWGSMMDGCPENLGRAIAAKAFWMRLGRAALAARTVNSPPLIDAVVKAAKECLPTLENANGTRGWNIEASRVAGNLRAALSAFEGKGGGS